MIHLRKQSGFTLIETLIYLGLFGLLIGGGVLAAFNIIEGTNRNQAQIMLTEEGNFLLAKINWSLSSAATITVPTPDHLLVTAVGGATTEYQLSSSDMSLTTSATSYTLSNSNVKVSNLVFDHQATSGSESVKSSFTLSSNTSDGKLVSQDFSSSKFIRR